MLQSGFAAFAARSEEGTWSLGAACRERERQPLYLQHLHFCIVSCAVCNVWLVVKSNAGWVYNIVLCEVFRVISLQRHLRNNPITVDKKQEAVF